MSNPPTPPNNPNPDHSKQLLDSIVGVLNNPLIFEFASRHPIIPNIITIITAVLLPLLGVRFFQLINDSQDQDSTFITKVCDSYAKEVRLGNNEIILNTSWTTSENDTINNENITNNNPKNEALSFTCQYKIKRDNTILPEPRESLIIPRISSQEERVINSSKICDLFKGEVQERLNTEKEENESIGDIKVEDKEDREGNQLPFYCTYQTLKDGRNSGSKDIYVELNPLFSDLITASYNEERINMKGVCKDETIIKQMKEKAREKRFYNEAAGDEIKPGKPLLSVEEKKDVYPVFRWVCSYDIKRSKEENGIFRARGNDYIDLNLDLYCENKANKEQTERVKPTHHDYNDPYSLYCANPGSPPKD